MKNDKTLFSYTSPNKNLSYSHSVADPPEETPKELHHDINEICIFLSGDVMMFIEGLSYPITPGDILCIPNRELHRLKVLSPTKYERIVIHFSESYISSVNKEGAQSLLDFLLVGDDPEKSRRINKARLQSSQAQNLLDRIEYYISSSAGEKDLMIQVLMIEFLSELKRIQERTGRDMTSPIRQDKRISQVTEYINNHLEEKMTLDGFSERFYINKYHLCHLFKRETGFTVFEYICNKRIIKAKTFLLEGSALLDACYSSGFTDYANFYKAFKKIIGMSPKQFIKSASERE
jgi:AraC-like DNA-binding protein/mannose-6-phosphate isomerase-like protein (cupin superfamily)